MAKVQTIEIVDIENVRNEKLRYQKNSLAYLLGFGGLAFSVLNAFIALNTALSNTWTIFKILMNIFILLFGFLSCEKVKNYSKKYSIIMFVFAGVCVLRIFWFPLQFIINWHKYKSTGDNSIATKNFSEQIYSVGQKKGYLPQSGYLRGSLCIVFLIISALFFAFSGYVGYSKTVKLEKYLQSVNVDFDKR